jgi:hypothetical protein
VGAPSPIGQPRHSCRENCAWVRHSLNPLYGGAARRAALRAAHRILGCTAALVTISHSRMGVPQARAALDCPKVSRARANLLWRFLLGATACGGLLPFAAVRWRRGLARGAGQATILASVADIRRPEFGTWFLNPACPTDECGFHPGLNALTWRRGLTHLAGQPAVLAAIGDVHWPEC